MLSQAEEGIHRTAVRIWIDEPLVWSDYADRIDPLGAMTDDWSKAVDAHLIILVEPDMPMDDMLAEAQAVDIPIHRLVIHRDYDATVILRLRKTLRIIRPDIVHTADVVQYNHQWDLS